MRIRSIVNPFDGDVITTLGPDFGSAFEGEMVEAKIVELPGN